VIPQIATRNQYCCIETTVSVTSIIRNTQNCMYLSIAQLLPYHRFRQGLRYGCSRNISFFAAIFILLLSQAEATGTQEPLPSVAPKAADEAERVMIAAEVCN
jgi:hypothetical protein